MYVNERSGFDFLTDPYQGEFGALSEDTTSAVAAALTPCAARALYDQSGAVDCVWNALRGLIEASGDVQATLQMIVSSDCATALAMLGLPSSVTSLVCAIPTISSVWRAVQSRATSELSRIEGAVRSGEAEASYNRGRDRTAAEGGGHTLVDAAGVEIAVRCPGYIKDIMYDAAGNIAGYAVQPEGDYPPGPCPQDARPKAGVAIVARPIVKTLPKLSFVRPGSSMYKADDATKVPWYKNKWFWIGTAAVLTVGGTVVVVSRRSR